MQMASIVDMLYVAMEPAFAGLYSPLSAGWATFAALLGHIAKSIDVTLQLGATTVVRMEWAEQIAQQYINIPLGLGDATTAKYLLTFFAAYLVCGVLPSLPREVRKLWCTVAGVMMMQFVFGVNYLHVVATSLFSYTVLAAGQHFPALRSWCHLISGLLVFAYLCLRQITRSGVNASSVDDSIVQMVLTIKLYTLGYNLYDGTADAENIAKGIEQASAGLAKDGSDKSARAQKALYQDRQARAINHLPTLVDFLGYIFNPATLMSGPAIEYKDYITAINRERLPSPPRYLPVAIKFVVGLCTLSFSAIYKAKIPISGVYDQAAAVNAGLPDAPSLLYRILYAHAAVCILRCQYYGCWKLAEGAAVLGGFGYREVGKSNPVFEDTEWLVGAANFRAFWRFILGASYEQTLSLLGVRLKDSPALPDWEGASNVTPLSVETRKSPDNVVRLWNHYTQSWLERYIHKRVPRAYGLNRWLTFGASAFWHGFYSGYYLGFFTVPLMQDSVRSLYEAGGPALQYLGLSWIGVPAHTPTFAAVVLVEFVAIHLAWAYILVPFCLFEAHKGLAVWRSVGYAGHLIPLAYFLLAAVLRRLFPQAPLPGKSKGQVGKDKEKVKGAEGDAAKPAQGGSDGPAPTGAVEVEREPARPSMRLPKAHGRPGSTSPSPRLVSATSPRSPKLGSPRAASPNAAKKRR